MAYKPVEHEEGKSRFAIITPDPNGEFNQLIVRLELLSEILDQYDEDNNKTYKVKLVDRTEKWVQQFPEA